MPENEEERLRERSRLEWRDYVAITIAMLQTTLLPVLLVGILLVLFAILLIR
jgi:hypothetical protein